MAINIITKTDTEFIQIKQETIESNPDIYYFQDVSGFGKTSDDYAIVISIPLAVLTTAMLELYKTVLEDIDKGIPIFYSNISFGMSLLIAISYILMLIHMYVN